MTIPPGEPPPYGPPQQPYYGPPPPGPYPPPQPATNWWAIVSLVFGLLGGVLISVVCGIVGLNKAKQGRGGRGLAIAGLVLSGLWVLLLIVGVAIYLAVDGTGSVDAADAKVGDCLAEIPDGGRVLFIDVVGCEEPHKGEVFALFTMPAGDFPGQAAIDGYQDRCAPALPGYSTEAAEDPEVGLFVLYPTEDSWEDGDRAVTCIATTDRDRTVSLQG